ncbi:MAG: hypothetical protein AUJ12_06220 [Alphaproteobacteria bacterium CG1_02_46_17]|nr:MAG: hypothetical protein AUJ12_06220 [Alphaproteobacteria bacterium CG1_02_46_17]
MTEANEINEIKDAYSYLTHTIVSHFANASIHTKDVEGQRTATITTEGALPIQYKVDCREIIEQGEQLIADLCDPEKSRGVLSAIYAARGKGADDIPGSMGFNAPRFVAWEVETAKLHLGMQYNAHP